MKKDYLSPYSESIKLNPMSLLMQSVDGDLGDLGEITNITDSIIQGPDEFLIF